MMWIASVLSVLSEPPSDKTSEMYYNLMAINY